MPSPISAAPRKVASNFSQIVMAAGTGFAGASGLAIAVDRMTDLPNPDGTSPDRIDRQEARDMWVGARSNTFILSAFTAGLMIGPLYTHARRIIGSPELAAKAAGGRAMLDALAGNAAAKEQIADAVVQYGRENPAFAASVADAVARGDSIADAAVQEIESINPREVTVMRNIYGASAGAMIATVAAPSWLPEIPAPNTGNQ